MPAQQVDVPRTAIFAVAGHGPRHKAIFARISSRKTTPLAAALLFAGVVSSSAAAEELRPIHAASLQLGDITGVAYYTAQGGGYHVVATLAAQNGPPVRFESTLLPGQTSVVSVPGDANGTSRIIEFLRKGDRLLVETRRGPSG
jgi:hypothetical protein